MCTAKILVIHSSYVERFPLKTQPHSSSDGISKSSGFIIWILAVSMPNHMAIYPGVAETVWSGPINCEHTNRLTLASIGMAKKISRQTKEGQRTGIEGRGSQRCFSCIMQ